MPKAWIALHCCHFKLQMNLEMIFKGCYQKAIILRKVPPFGWEFKIYHKMFPNLIARKCIIFKRLMIWFICQSCDNQSLQKLKQYFLSMEHTKPRCTDTNGRPQVCNLQHFFMAMIALGLFSCYYCHLSFSLMLSMKGLWNSIPFTWQEWLVFGLAQIEV